jgi:outer membrane protein assembly factor BamB
MPSADIPLTSENRPLETDQLRSAERELFRWTCVSMVFLVPVVWIVWLAAIALDEVSAVVRVLSFTGATIVALVAVEGPFIVILISLGRDRSRPLAGGVAVGVGRLWLTLLVLTAFASLLPLGPYGVPWSIVLFLNPPVALSIAALSFLFVLAQRRLIRSGGILWSTSDLTPSRWSELYHHLPLASLIFGCLAAGTMHTIRRQIAKNEARQRAAAYSAAHPPKPRPPAPPALPELWVTQLLPAVGGTIYPIPPAVANDGAIVAAFDSALVGVSRDGVVRWRNFSVHALTSPPVIGADGTIYVAGRGDSLYAVRPDGRLRWTVSIGQAGRASRAGLLPPGVVSDAVYVGAPNGPLTRVSRDGAIEWRALIGTAMTSPIATPNGSVIVVGEHLNYDGRDTVYRVDDRGRVEWRVGGQFTGPLALAPNGTVLVTDAGEVAAISSRGEIRHLPRPSAGWLLGGPLVVGADGTIYSSSNETLAAFGADGSVRWKRRVELPDNESASISGSPTLSANGQLIISVSRRILVIDGRTGADLAEFRLEPWLTAPGGGMSPGPPSPVAVGRDGTIYFTDAARRMHALIVPAGRRGTTPRRGA